MNDYKQYFQEAYKKLLLEKDFDISDEVFDGIKKWKDVETEADTLSSLHDLEDGVEVLELTDPDSWSEKEIDDKKEDGEYLGNVVLECVSCHNHITVSPDKVYEDDETGTCCPDIKCPICNSDLGYTVLGKIEKFDAPSEEEFKDLEFPEESDEDEVEEEEDDDFEESLHDKIRRRTFTEAKENVCPDCGQDPCVCEGEDCDDCDESCSKDEELNEAGNLHVTDQKDMKRLGSKKWNSADNKEYFDKISKDNDIYVNPDKKMGIAKNKRTGKSYKFDKDNNEIKDESLDEAKLDEKLPKSLANKKDFISNKFGSDIDFENSTFDEISPEDLAGMSREDRENVFGVRDYGSVEYEIGKRGSRSGKLIKHDWGKERNTGVDVGNTAEVGRELRGSKLYKANPVAKDPEKMAARKGNEYIGKANAARKNARASFGADPDRYSWNEPEKQRLSDIKSAQKYRNTAASEMNKRFKDPNIDDYRRTKDEVGWDKKWLDYSNDDLERATDDVTSARLARDYGTRYARDVVDNERRAKEYMDRAEQARKAGVEYMRNAPADELERAKDNLNYATQHYNNAKDSVEKHEKDINNKLAAFKDRHNKRMGKNEALNEAPEGYDYDNLYTQDEKSKMDSQRLIDKIKVKLEQIIETANKRTEKFSKDVIKAWNKTNFDLDDLIDGDRSIAYYKNNNIYFEIASSITEAGEPDEDTIEEYGEGLAYPFIAIGKNAAITAYGADMPDSSVEIDINTSVVNELKQYLNDLNTFSSNFMSILNQVLKQAYDRLDSCIKSKGYAFDESMNIVKAPQLTEALNNLSLDTDDQHLEISADETGRISVISDPVGAQAEDIPDTMVAGEESVVPLDAGEMGVIEDNISPEEQEEILDAGDELKTPVGVEEPLESEGEVAEEEPVEGEEEFEIEEESFNYLGNTFAKKLYENVNNIKITNRSKNKDKFIVEGLITFNSGVQKPTQFIFENAQKTPTGRIVLEGLNTTFFPTKAFKLRGRLVSGKLVCESLRYNYSINKLNESTGKQEPVAVRGIVRGK